MASYGYDTVTPRLFSVYTKHSNQQPAYKVGTRSGNSITWGSEGSLGSGTATYGNAISIGSDKFFVVYEDGTDIKAVIATTTSSNTASLGTAVTLLTGASDLHDNPGVGNTYCYGTDDSTTAEYRDLPFTIHTHITVIDDQSCFLLKFDYERYLG